MDDPGGFYIEWDVARERWVVGKCYGESTYNNRPIDAIEEDADARQ